MCAEVDFADVIKAQYSGVACVWGVVSSTVVNGAAGGECQARMQPIFLDESPGAVLQLLTEEVTIEGQNHMTAHSLPQHHCVQAAIK